MVKWRSLLPQGPQSSTPRNGSLSGRSSASASTRSPCCTPASQQEDMIGNGQYRYLNILHLTTDAVVPREEQAAGHEDEEDDEDGDTDRPQQVLVTRRLLMSLHHTTTHLVAPHVLFGQDLRILVVKCKLVVSKLHGEFYSIYNC